MERSLALLAAFLAIQYVYWAETSKLSSTHPTPSQPGQTHSYWRETKKPLMCPERASHARHLGEPRAVTKQSQQQPTVRFKRRPQMAFLPCGQEALEWLGPLQLGQSLPSSPQATQPIRHQALLADLFILIAPGLFQASLQPFWAVPTSPNCSHCLWPSSSLCHLPCQHQTDLDETQEASV